MISFEEQRAMESHILSAATKNGWRVVSNRPREYVGRSNDAGDWRPVDQLEFDITVEFDDGQETASYRTFFVGLGIKNRLQWFSGPRMPEVDDVIESWNQQSVGSPVFKGRD